MNSPRTHIGVLTGGGDCPGLNAVIRAVTRSLIRDCGARVLGIEDGFAGLIEGRFRPLDWMSVAPLTALGGTVLGTSNRANPLADEETTRRTLANAARMGLSALVAVGGDGTMTISQALYERGLPIVGVPKTIDNDIEGCERSFGFDTAVATATEALERVQTTALSHGRVMIVETMGRYSGWIALEAGIAGSAHVILLPEIDYELEAVAAVCRKREKQEKYTLICVAEGAKPRGGSLTIERRLEGSPDPIRLGGVAHALREALQPHVASEVRSTVLGHVQRGGSPTPFDRILATHFGVAAAQLVHQGEFGQMVATSGERMTRIPLSRVAGVNRKVPLDHPLMQTSRQIGISFGEPRL
jgi:6-phosphofructokinase 1